MGLMSDRRIISVEDYAALVGSEVGRSRWTVVDQAMIDLFAEATSDHQFIHVDPVRAQRETPFGGTIVIKTRQTLTVTVLDATDSSAIQDARVYIEADSGGPETAGTVIMNATTNASGVATATYDFQSSQPIIGRVRKGSTTTYYQTNAIGGPLTSTPLNVTVLMVPDE